jgi:hypothetical protein
LALNMTTAIMKDIQLLPTPKERSTERKVLITWLSLPRQADEPRSETFAHS